MKSNLCSKTSSVIRQMRAYRGITQDNLYVKSKIAKSTISAIEKGTANPSLETLQSLADALNCKINVTLEPIDN